MRWLAMVVVCLLATASARAGDDWAPTRDPFDQAVVKRWKAILAKNPHDARALAQLLAMYRTYRKIETLEAEYRTQLATGEDWATLVVIARLPRSSRADTGALWKRALAINPRDRLGWLAAGDVAIDAGVACDAYTRAIELSVDANEQKVALTKLVGKAGCATAAVDRAYAQLVALAPKDGALWLDRGNAQLAAKQFAAASESFATAEKLLRDPERLTAMMNRGLALEGLGRGDDAIAQYEATLEKVPRGYYLGEELVGRIVGVDRVRKRLPAAIARLEKRWPEKARAYFEWVTLADLYVESGDDERGLVAYRRALAIAPTEVATQRKLIALLDKIRPDESLAQHEAAARIAPGDADLQLSLAKRYHPEQTQKAFAVLEALAWRMNRNINVRSTIAAIYESWNELPRAIREYEAIAAIEPKDPDHAVTLGDAYWRAENQAKARAAWQRLDKIGTPKAWLRLGDLLSMHAVWKDAVAAYSKVLATEPTDANALYGRARANDQQGQYAAALEDAQRAVALTATANYADGLRNRQILIRVLDHWSATKADALDAALAKWSFAFDRGDNAAGYLLAIQHARIGSRQQHELLTQLYRRVPGDATLGIAIARSFVHRREFERAKAELAEVGKRNPARAKEVAELIAQIDEERNRLDADLLERARRARADAQVGSNDLAGSDRIGIRFALGSDVRTTSSAQLGIGLYGSWMLARGTAKTMRFEFSKRDDTHEEVDAFAISGGIATRIVSARDVELVAGAAARFELRYGSQAAMSSWNTAELGGDLTLEALPRALSGTLGLRFHQSLTDAGRPSTLLVELGFEVR